MAGRARRPKETISGAAAEHIPTPRLERPEGASQARESAFLTVVVPGPLVTWKRTTTFGGRRLTPAAQRTYQERVYLAGCLAVASAPGWSRDRRYAVDIVWTPVDRRRADVDNAAKTCLDALNGCLWLDDSQVDDMRVRRAEPSRTAPGIVVRVTVLE